MKLFPPLATPAPNGPPTIPCSSCTTLFVLFFLFALFRSLYLIVVTDDRQDLVRLAEQVAHEQVRVRRRLCG